MKLAIGARVRPRAYGTYADSVSTPVYPHDASTVGVVTDIDHARAFVRWDNGMTTIATLRSLVALPAETVTKLG